MQVFEIKKKAKVLNNQDDLTLNNYNKLSQLTENDLLSKFNSALNGLSDQEANNRLEKNGLNTVIKDDKKPWIYFLLISFKDQFIIILIALAIINFFLGDHLGSSIILLIAIISALIRFFQDYSVYKFNRKLKAQIYSTATVLRNNKEQTIKTEKVVIGDIIKLNAGSIIPADLIIIEVKDLFVNQSVFTGESVPVEKKTSTAIADNIFNIDNICLMGSSVISGSATGISINTGFNTYLGTMGQEIDVTHELTNFDIGMKNITKLLISYMLVVCCVVFFVDGILRQNFREAILFALSVAVGITPSMLPMIVNVNLTKGSKMLAKKKTLVKRIESIQNLGAIDILCTDKTGTLTEDNIILQKYVDATGKDDITILDDAYLNSYFGTGMKNLVDRAIISYAKENKVDHIIKDYEKVDEIPFDYTRRKMSVVVKNKNDYKMITKGTVEEIIKVCSKVKINNSEVQITDELINSINLKSNELASSGMQVIALATKKEYSGINVFNAKDEKAMTFIGFVGFLDPPKKDVKKVLNNLKDIGVNIKILTGDNQFTTQNICNIVGLDSNRIMLGSQLEELEDKELSKKIEDIDIFARLNPLQKERVIKLYRANGHVVGYMGDGVNDAPSMVQADIGISVNTATDIAKEASDIILLEKSLKVIYDGVIEGRKTYGNIIKYMKMALSGDFGDVFSIMIASIFLPFLPLLPIQMLIQDFIYDFSQIGIPYDNVDEEFLKQPKKWDTKGISRFMKVMGMISSIVDVISFIIFWYIFKYNSIGMQAYFQTAWFVICLLTELMIIINVRTSKTMLIKSHPSKQLTILTLFSIMLTILTPLLLSSISTFNYVILPVAFYGYAILLVIVYFIIVTVTKKIYIKKYHEWL